MSSYLVELKQHTPLIHFQPKQDGATIRATELKPKIDDFIINRLKEVNPELYQKYQSVINGDNFPVECSVSSKYKISIASKLQEKKYNSGTPYFGDNKNEFLFFRDIKVKVFSYNEKLAKLIRDALPYVLVFENFGTRQGKGFGSFTPMSMSKDEFEEILKLNSNTLVYRKQINGRNEVLKQINKDYNLLKSGNNFGTKYEKSKIYYYMNRGKIKLEKAMIKSQLKDKYKDIYDSLKGYNERNNRSDQDNEYEYRYARAMLGLAEHFEYQTKTSDEKVNIQICDSEKTIERFKSPIQFKVFDDNIYLIVNDIPNEMYNREFTFKLSKTKGTSRNKILKNIDSDFLKIKTPSKEEFNLCNFIKTEIGSLKYERLV